MHKIFDSELTLIVNSGYIYFPLLFDPAIDTEITANLEMSNALIQSKGKHYVKAISVRSLSESYPKLFPDLYQRLRNSCIDRYIHSAALVEMTIDVNIENIIFHILPHFMRRSNRLRTGKPSTEEILDLIGASVVIPDEFYNQADKFINVEELVQNMEKLSDSTTSRHLSEGPLSARELDLWLQEEVTARILDEEKKRLNALIQERHRFTDVHRRYIATLLFMQERGFFEKDGAGFYRDDTSRDYVIYKRTGEYALKDYFARIYLFPDCRVAVRSGGYLRPVVLETYKHPFLPMHAPNQQICIGEPTEAPPMEFSPENVIRAIEEGINALFYGYNSRKRNGHHSLDRNTTYFRSVDFDNYIIPEDHPKILSGEVEVKNAFK